MARVEASSPELSNRRTNRKTCPGTQSTSQEIRSNTVSAICREFSDVSYELAKRTFALLDTSVKKARQHGYKRVGIPRSHSNSQEHVLVRRILRTDAVPGSARALIEERLLGATERGLRYSGHKGKNGRFHGAIIVLR